MKLFEIVGLRNPPEIKDFKNKFVDKKIYKAVHYHSASNDSPWVKNIQSIMKKYDFELVGAGINGAVFKNSKYPYVLKIYRKDEGYDKWLYFCLNNQHNPYVPKIKGKPVRINNIFTAIRIEILEPCHNAPEGIIEVDDLILLIKSPPNRIKEKSEKLGYHLSEENINYLIEICKFLNEFEPFTDLSVHNIMQRPNGQPVIIDPIYMKIDDDFY